MEPTHVLFQQLGISVLLGLLVGLQREHAASRLAGMRTFPLITLLGTVTALLAVKFGGLVVVGGLVGVVAVLTIAHLSRIRQPDPDLGTTTDVAMLVMFGVGALLTVEGALAAAIAVGGGVAVLLQFKPELHRFAQRLGDDDLRAIMQFVLITCIILPVLPNRTFGPLEVFNPRETWLMVVLIVGMSLGGYIAYKFLGRDAGIFLGGVLGGAISSTATTVSFARQARGKPLNVNAATIVILVASTILYGRVLIEIAVVSWDFLRYAVVPVVVLALLTLAPAIVLWWRVRRQSTEMPEPENPTHLRSAILFGLMYAVVLFALAAAEKYAGDQGLFAVAALSGLTDMDAITLSTARMSVSDPTIVFDGWRLITVAAIANLVFKAIIAGVLGGWQLFIRVAQMFLIPAAGGGLMLALM